MPELRTLTRARIVARTGAARRSPRRYAADRVCLSPGCSVNLSVYNRKPFCSHHWPVAFPRIRGSDWSPDSEDADR